MSKSSANKQYAISEITLAYKLKFRASERPAVTCMQEACEMFKQVWDDNKLDTVEEGKVMLLNRANRVIGVCHLSTGGITGTVLDVRHVFAAAIKANSCQIIFAHNHPSDNLSPSHANRSLTEKLKLAGDNLDIKVLDHLVICRSGFHSLMTGEAIQSHAPQIQLRTNISDHIDSKNVCKSPANEKRASIL